MKTKTSRKSFRVSSDKIVFGDPCYSSNTTMLAKNGRWEAAVDRKTCDGWGNRISRITVHHSDFDPVSSKVSKKTFSVDSGQAGVFCASAVDAPGEFYSWCCSATNSEKGCGFIEGGFVSSSGYGDGFYEAIIHKNSGLVVCVELVFIGDD